MIAVAAENANACAIDLADELERDGRGFPFLRKNLAWFLLLLRWVEMVERARRGLDNRVELVAAGAAGSKLPFAVGGKGRVDLGDIFGTIRFFVACAAAAFSVGLRLPIGWPNRIRALSTISSMPARPSSVKDPVRSFPQMSVPILSLNLSGFCHHSRSCPFDIKARDRLADVHVRIIIHLLCEHGDVVHQVSEAVASGSP